MQQPHTPTEVIARVEQLHSRVRQLSAGAVDDAVRSEIAAIADVASLDIRLAKLLTPQGALSLLSPSGELAPFRARLAAELLMLDAMEAEHDGDVGRALLSYEKALLLFGILDPSGAGGEGWPDIAGRVTGIIAGLARVSTDRSGSA